MNGTVAYIGIGSNLANPFKTAGKPSKVFPLKRNRAHNRFFFYRTEPVGIEDQDFFVNAVVEIKTELSVHRLMQTLMAIEKEMWRIRDVKGGPRIIDLDLLYGQQIISEPDLMVPHPEAHRRGFVLEPLCEIASYFIHPVWRIHPRIENRLCDHKLALFGVPPREYWPYDTGKFDREPPAFCYAFAANYQALDLLPPGRARPLGDGSAGQGQDQPGRRAGAGLRFQRLQFPGPGGNQRGNPVPDPRGAGDRRARRHGRRLRRRPADLNALPGGVETTGALLIRNSWGGVGRQGLRLASLRVRHPGDRRGLVVPRQMRVGGHRRLPALKPESRDSGFRVSGLGFRS